MFASLARSIFGSYNDRVLKAYRQQVVRINAMEADLAKLSDTQLTAQTAKLRKLLSEGKTLDDILPEAFATVREASKRAMGMRPFDVQLMGAMALHEGFIPEMRTGEGKTLTATLAIYLNALEGKGVHVVTVNDYLAQRDANWMSPIFKKLDLSVGFIVSNLPDEMRRAAYASDVTYGTNNEYGFDYLRDNMKYRIEDMVQRPFNYAIIDEVDSILVDEARTPLIISGAIEDSAEMYRTIDRVIPRLVAEDFEKDEKHKTVILTDRGNEHAEEILKELGIMTEGSLYDINNITIVHHVNQALRAHKLFQRDVDYIVKDDAVIIIDEFTGRMMEGRRFSEGLHQALEAKEGVKVQNENQVLASITFQNYFRMYPKLAGMTGTALTEKDEFEAIYNLRVVEIPTNLPAVRADQHDEIYRTNAEKDEALVVQIAKCQRTKQPVLVGTVSIDKSERLSALLKDRTYIRNTGRSLIVLAKAQAEQAEALRLQKKEAQAVEAQLLADEWLATGQYMEAASANNPPIPHQVLNARYHEQEAHIIAQAGQPGAVTIATNMAGRGTDIKLGGNLEVRLAQEVPPDADAAARESHEARLREEIAQAYEVVKAAGGLCVIGSERHESRRIDNQLRGRSGRQGDPGASKFYISLEDDLMRIFGGDKMDSMLQMFGLQKGQPIIHPMINSAIERAQKKVEAQHFEVRKNLLRFDNVMNDQRKVVYEQRREIMTSEDVSALINDMREDVIEGIISMAIPEGSYAEQWDVSGLKTEAARLLALHIPAEDWAKEEGMDANIVRDRLTKLVEEKIAKRDALLPAQVLRQIERSALLQLLDQTWKEHLLNLDYLRQGIQLRAYGQKDPLNEYKTEAFALFHSMLQTLRERVTTYLCHMEVSADQPPPEVPRLRQPAKTVLSRGSEPPAAPDAAPGQQTARILPFDKNDTSTWASTPRNAACPCGSGKKYKYCHGQAN